MNELKPCPFCGGNAFIAWRDKTFFGLCFDCGATSEKKYYVFKDEMERVFDSAADAWNMRKTNTRKAADANKEFLASTPQKEGAE